MKKHNALKRSISLLLSFAFLFTSLAFQSVDAWAEFKDSALGLLSGISNSISTMALTPEQEACEHNYVVRSANGATCVKKAYVSFRCSKCGATKTQNTALGHYYACNGIGYRVFKFKCKYCSASLNKSVDELIDGFYDNINVKTVRNNSNCFYDVYSDGTINIKDYVLMSKNTKHKLTNPNANETTQQVYRYICAMNGVKTLSAQQESTWMGSPDYEMNYIYNNTGKYPAMRGLDYMHDDFYNVNQRAIQWWNRGGLVTICWHTGSDFTGEWTDAMNDTVSDWEAMLTEGTNEYNQMIAGMDKAARYLKELENNGVTVLWRPFHEFDGGWFWWGKGTSDNFKTMWRIMYDRYTNYWHLNNLIWVLGYSHNGIGYTAWNPGDEYYDIIGADSYDVGEYPSLYGKVKEVNVSGKPIILHECGTNPAAEFFDNYPYAYFMTWHTNYLTDNNTTSNLSTLYNSERVITLDELDWSGY